MASRLRRRLAKVHNWLYERRHISTAAMLVLIVIYTASELGTQWPAWDEINWMILTGLPVGLAFLWRTNDIRDRFEEIADDLSEQNLVRFSTSGDQAFVEDRDRQATLHEEAKEKVEGDLAIWGFSICVVFVPLSLYVLHLVSGDEPLPVKILLYAVVVFMAFACGLRIGRMACYGWQGLSYKTMEIQGCLISIVPKLGHPDGSAGLAPIGQFYNHQVGKMTWLTGFLLVWLVILSVFHDEPFVSSQYPPLHTSLGLLALFIFILLQQFLGFILPMWSISRELGAWKTKAMKRNFDELKRIEAAQPEERHAEDPTMVLRKIDLRQQSADIATMGLWPASVETLRKFWFGRAASISIALLAGYNDIVAFTVGGI